MPKKGQRRISNKRRNASVARKVAKRSHIKRVNPSPATSLDWARPYAFGLLFAGLGDFIGSSFIVPHQSTSAYPRLTDANTIDLIKREDGTYD